MFASVSLLFLRNEDRTNHGLEPGPVGYDSTCSCDGSASLKNTRKIESSMRQTFTRAMDQRITKEKWMAIGERKYTYGSDSKKQTGWYLYDLYE